MSKQKILVSLIGHQPMPNLLTMRYLRPDSVLFVSSGNEKLLALRKERLENLARNSGIQVLPGSGAVDPWDINSVPEYMAIDLHSFQQNVELFFDVTGGTKAMSLGLARVAAQFPDSTMLYVESEGYHSFLREYRCKAAGELEYEQPVKLPPLFDISDFFYLHLGLEPKALEPIPPRLPLSDGLLFEQGLREALEPLVDEIAYSLKPTNSEEIDIVLRRRNRVALVECKSGKDAKSAYGILQLNNLASDRYLGTYTQKILAVNIKERNSGDGVAYPQNNAEMASEHGVFLLELPEWQPGHTWNAGELERIRKIVTKVFGD